MELLTEQIQPRLDPAALQVSNQFREAFLYLPETDQALSQHVETLQAIYELYSAMEHEMSDRVAMPNMLD